MFLRLKYIKIKKYILFILSCQLPLTPRLTKISIYFTHIFLKINMLIYNNLNYYIINILVDNCPKMFYCLFSKRKFSNSKWILYFSNILWKNLYIFHFIEGCWFCLFSILFEWESNWKICYSFLKILKTFL